MAYEAFCLGGGVVRGACRVYIISYFAEGNGIYGFGVYMFLIVILLALLIII